ncbi:uncharacterized protein LOC111312362 [Durio zibethinus]|uniref:Uncharacterized protein LOC111312362 n=1 Tax=Durio zibethinus TaxID=66656 RepID=A0A6P6ATR2_DURZI|nr:uncharacterized protein LOC111312362 [Durio zibethinus]
MLAPKSYTREDVVENQRHRNDVCMRRVLKACLGAGARVAEPGGLLFFSQIIEMIVHELLTEIEARLDFKDEMPSLDFNLIIDRIHAMSSLDFILIIDRIHAMSQDVEHALETANYDKLLQSGLQKADFLCNSYFIPQRYQKSNRAVSNF